MNNLIKLVAATLAVLSLQSIASEAVKAKEGETIQDRLKPAGSVCMSGDDCAAAPVQVSTSSGPRTGEELYKTKCTTCHGTGVAGAPKFGNAGDWGPRASQGLETLFNHAWNGLNAMPPKGTCSDCSEDEIKGAIKYMVDNSK